MDETELKHALEPLDGSKIGTLIHIGAGLCPDLARYTALATSSVVLLEPNPTLAEGLQAQVYRLPDRSPRVQVYPVALAGQDQTAPFHIYAIPDFGGLANPTALLQSYPGLTKNSTIIDVSCLSVATLLKKAKLSKYQENWLILEAAGVEQDLIDGLVSKAGSALFDRLLIRLSPSKMYQNSLGAREVLARLNALGYILQDAWASQDPDWLWFQLSPDLVAIKQAKLQQALTQSHEEMLKAEGQIAILKDMLLQGSEK